MSWPFRSIHPAFWIAGGLGTIHAAWSAYWAFGGRFLLDTVGEWAVAAARERPVATLAGLLAVAVIKVLAAWIPLLAETRRIPGRRLWRTLAWVGGPLLVLYGTVNSIAAIAVLAGWADPGPGEPDRLGLIGHAFVWDPLFALWGAALTVALVMSRGSRQDQRSRSE